MNIENQLQLIIKEKETAVEQYNRSKLLIEKLEQELRNAKELSPTSNGTLTMLQKEYSETINLLRDKIKVIQEKYDGEVFITTQRNNDVKILSKRIEELCVKLEESKKECTAFNHLLTVEREKYLNLEKQFISSENKLFCLGKKFSHINTLETERDKLIIENNKLSNDCNELEKALEICHKKMQLYEEKINKMLSNLDSLTNEKEIVTKKKKKYEEEIIKLQDKIQNLIEEKQKVNEELSSIKQHDEYKKTLLAKFSLENFSEYVNHEKINNDSLDEHDDECNLFTVESHDDNIFKLLHLLQRYKETLQKYLTEKKKLEEQCDASLSNTQKYKEYIDEANNVITYLKHELSKQKISARCRNEIQKYVNNMKITDFELNNHIQSQEELHNKWKKEVKELILKFKSRITNLNKKYKKSQRENFKLKKYIDKHVINRQNDSSS